MALPADAGLVYACFTHVPLTLALPPYVVPIYLGAAQHAGALNLRDLAPEWEPHHPVLGSTAGAFALKNAGARALSAGDPDRHLPVPQVRLARAHQRRARPALSRHGRGAAGDARRRSLRRAALARRGAVPGQRPAPLHARAVAPARLPEGVRARPLRRGLAALHRRSRRRGRARERRGALASSART